MNIIQRPSFGLSNIEQRTWLSSIKRYCNNAQDTVLTFGTIGNVKSSKFDPRLRPDSHASMYVA